MSSIRISPVVLSLLAAASLATTASAQVDIDVSPNQGNVGTLVVISAGKGVDFGSKAKVWLSQDGDSKKNVLKVDSKASSSTELICEVKRLDKNKIDETFHVNVQPKGGDVMTVEDAFTARNIEVLGDGYEFPAGQATTVNAVHMGSKPAKVKLGGKPAKVSEWNPDDGQEGVGGTFMVTPHKKVPNGGVSLEIKTKAGEIDTGTIGTVTGSSAGVPKGSGVSFKIGGQTFKSLKGGSNGSQLVASEILGHSILGAGGTAGKKTTFALALVLNWLPSDGDAVLTEAQLLDQGFDLVVTEIKLSADVNAYNFTDFDCSVQAVGDRAVGTFSGSATKVQGNGAQTIQVTDGQFNVPILDV